MPGIDLRHVYSLTDFLRNHKAHLARIKEGNVDEVLTVNGEAQVVVISIDRYQEMEEAMENSRFTRALNHGIAQADEGRTVDAKLAIAELRAKYGL